MSAIVVIRRHHARGKSYKLARLVIFEGQELAVELRTSATFYNVRKAIKEARERGQFAGLREIDFFRTVECVKPVI